MSCEKSMAYKSARGIAIITAVFMAIISTDAVTGWSTLDTFGKSVYGLVMAISVIAESVVLYLMYMYRKEIKR